MSNKKVARCIVFGTMVVSTLFATPTQTLSWDFEKTETGKLPTGWIIDATHPPKQQATWEVIEEKHVPSGKKILSLTQIHNLHGGTFNLCYTRSVIFLDGEISVKFKSNNGSVDQGGGIMWRVQDGGNYYVARFNPLENNFRFYSVKDGIRREIASADIKLSAGWHEMKVIQKGKHFKGYLDGKKLLEAENDSCIKSGAAGVWTKADAATSFDDLTIRMEVK